MVSFYTEERLAQMREKRRSLSGSSISSLWHDRTGSLRLSSSSVVNVTSKRSSSRLSDMRMSFTHWTHFRLWSKSS